MTSLNKLFIRYFILTVALVMVLATLVSNFGASVFFKQFVLTDNIEKNQRIVDVVQSLVDDEDVPKSSYPVVLSMLSRQQQVNLMLSQGDDVIFKSTVAGRSGTDPEYINLEYEIGDYSLLIGRVKDPFYDLGNAQFLRTLNILYAAVFVLSMLIATLTALFLSRRFNRPIVQLKENVNNISMNRFELVKAPKSKARELNELTDDIGRLAEQMEREEEMRKRLSNDIVHELKTPISVLSTNIEAILDGVYKPDEERMSVLLDQINRLTRLVNNLSDLTLLESEYKDMKKDEVELSKIIENLYTVYVPVANDRNVEFRKEITGPVYIMGNSDRLLQVFVNIISNAFKYTDNGGTITIRLYGNHSSAICEIEDNGIGIDEHDLPFIFNRFYRGDESRSRETGGAGIGLSIAKAVISAHGGDIKVESKKHKGTKISITLPQKNK